MKKISKLLSVTLAASLLVTGCAANGNKSKGGGGAKGANSSPDYRLTNVSFPLKEKVTLKIVTSSGLTSPKDPNDKLIFKRLEEATNLHINWINFTHDQFGEKKNLLLASGDLPDAFFNGGFSDYDLLKYAKDGVIIPVEELVEKYMPNLKAIYDKHPEYKAFATAPDGHMYSFPWIEELGSGKERIQSISDMAFINIEWLNKLGLEMPTTIEEFEKVLIAFRDQDPNGNGKKDEIPLSFIVNNGNEGPQYLFGAFGLGDNWDHTVVTNDKKVVYTRADEGYKEAMKWMYSLNQKGLIDPEAFTQDWATFVAKGKDNRFGVYFTWDKDNVTGNNDKYELMPPLKGPNGEANLARCNGFGLDRSRAVITSANQNLELTARWFDKMYEPLQSAQNNWGTYGDPNQQNIFELVDGKLKHLPLGDTAPGELRDKTSVGGPLAILDEYYGNQVTKPDDAARRLERIKKLVPYMKSDYVYPRVFLTNEESDEYTKLEALIAPYTDRKTVEWMSKGGVEKEWNDYLAELDKMGLKKFMEIKQNAFDKFYSNNK
ncbi:ABC transporter substrate-binding protein [Clostridium sp. SYSU_GA19001]|uniref:ABC transporter substrate-binding protein n=1 Tax=Clostridium caldaquaticum TaxID=2940653 RepID=UPI00207786AF|nr:ABC transporter substrate-binding protein [Clostridium caldaquaticum]MCM8711845.1 ABC transporter substrate-binding protein [Clostridium caldaquaticum]